MVRGHQSIWEEPPSPLRVETAKGRRQHGDESHVARWRRGGRRVALASVAESMAGARWSTRLLSVLLEELHVDDEVAELLSHRTLGRRPRSAHVVMVALAIRHSWRPDDFQDLLRRLGIQRTSRRKTSR